MKITIDAGKCTGHGWCYVLAPDLIEADDEGHGVAKDVQVPAELETSAQEVADSCPESAVLLTD